MLEYTALWLVVFNAREDPMLTATHVEEECDINECGGRREDLDEIASVIGSKPHEGYTHGYQGRDGADAGQQPSVDREEYLEIVQITLL